MVSVNYSNAKYLSNKYIVVAQFHFSYSDDIYYHYALKFT